MLGLRNNLLRVELFFELESILAFDYLVDFKVLIISFILRTFFLFLLDQPLEELEVRSESHCRPLCLQLDHLNLLLTALYLALA